MASPLCLCNIIADAIDALLRPDCPLTTVSRAAAVLLCLLLILVPSVLAAAEPGGRLIAERPQEPRYLGMEYEVWFPGIPSQGHYGGENYWEPRWGTPLLGTYDSADTKVIDRHAQWLVGIGVDFVLIDWTNNIANDLTGAPIVGETIRTRTDALFREYQRLKQIGEPHPKIAILLGAQNEGGVTAERAIASGYLNKEADYVYDHLVARDSNLYFMHDGRPLLLIYLGTPAAFNNQPTWTDQRFTVRWMGGFLESQPNLYGGRPAENPFWSWIDRIPIPAHAASRVEAVTVTQAYLGQQGWLDRAHWPPARGRIGADGTTTFQAQWQRARSYHPQIILLNQWNEFSNKDRASTGTGDEHTPSPSNDLEPTRELGCDPIIAVQRAVAAWKRVALPPVNCSAF